MGLVARIEPAPPRPQGSRDPHQRATRAAIEKGGLRGLLTVLPLFRVYYSVFKGFPAHTSGMDLIRPLNEKSRTTSRVPGFRVAIDLGISQTPPSGHNPRYLQGALGDAARHTQTHVRNRRVRPSAWRVWVVFVSATSV